MKRLSLMLLSILLLSTLVLAGCAQPPAPAPKPATAPSPAPAPATVPVPAPTPAPTPTPVSSPKPTPTQVTKLLFTDHNPPTAWGSKNANEPLFKKIEQATNGRIKVESYYSESLAKGPDAWKAVVNGVADIGWIAHAMLPGLTPLSDVMALPFLPFDSNRHAAGVFWKLAEKFPEMQKEYADIVVLLRFTAGPYILITTKKQVKTMDDLKGQKLRTIAGPPTDAIKLLGAVPTMVNMAECYLAMQKGVIDGMGAPTATLGMFNFHEVIKYMTRLPFHMTYMTIAINKAKWNSLTPDVQKAIMDLGGYEGSRWYSEKYSDDSVQETYDKIKQWEAKGGQKIEIYDLPKDELTKWQEVGGKPIWNAWSAQMEAKGLPGKAVIAETVKIIDAERGK